MENGFHDARSPILLHQHYIRDQVYVMLSFSLFENCILFFKKQTMTI